MTFLKSNGCTGIDLNIKRNMAAVYMMTGQL